MIQNVRTMATWHPTVNRLTAQITHSHPIDYRLAARWVLNHIAHFGEQSQERGVGLGRGCSLCGGDPSEMGSPFPL